MMRGSSDSSRLLVFVVKVVVVVDEVDVAIKSEGVVLEKLISEGPLENA
jgi:hypothetical protein